MGGLRVIFFEVGSHGGVDSACVGWWFGDLVVWRFGGRRL